MDSLAMDRDRLIADLKRDEGFRAKPYRDSEGLLTIGYGTLIEAGISEAEAELLLVHRLEQMIAELVAIHPIAHFPEAVQRALCNMAYNLGVVRLSEFRRMWRALEDGYLERAADEALDSKWARQVGSRSERIAELIRSAKRV